MLEYQEYGNVLQKVAAAQAIVATSYAAPRPAGQRLGVAAEPRDQTLQTSVVRVRQLQSKLGPKLLARQRWGPQVCFAYPQSL